ncbi:MAG TPA: hydrogenase nickel incorporation protein HypB [Tepidisphaeraceae bacterium]|nr:hydrogenase nickel incorporation protein HypB [Tepidisphaeraceae bacterium]
MTPELKTRFDLNGQIARANRAVFDAAGVAAISLVGPAGSGKTSLIESLLGQIDTGIRTAAIVCDMAAERQAERLARLRCKAIPLVTNNLAAINVRQALNQLNLNEVDLVIIESECNAHSPVEFDLGQHSRASVFSVAGGDDKATEYPFLIAGSDVVLLTKIDLLPLVTFDFKVFSRDVARVKPKVPIFHLSVQSNQGIEQWVEWVESHLASKIKGRLSQRGSGPFIRLPNQ